MDLESLIKQNLRLLEPNPNLPPNLRLVAERYYEFAEIIYMETPKNSWQLFTALDMLLMSKDAAVRAQLYVEEDSTSEARS